jgi:hypothetical protein
MNYFRKLCAVLYPVLLKFEVCDLEVEEEVLNSLSVFHMPHSGHFPRNAGLSYPHSWQTNEVSTLAIIKFLNNSL